MKGKIRREGMRKRAGKERGREGREGGKVAQQLFTVAVTTKERMREVEGRSSSVVE